MRGLRGAQDNADLSETANIIAVVVVVRCYNVNNGKEASEVTGGKIQQDVQGKVNWQLNGN